MAIGICVICFIAIIFGIGVMVGSRLTILTIAESAESGTFKERIGKETLYVTLVDED